MSTYELVHKLREMMEDWSTQADDDPEFPIQNAIDDLHHLIQTIVKQGVSK